MQSALDALSAHVAILDEQGTIIGINAAWRDFAIENGLTQPQFGLGTNYLAVCDRAARRNSMEAPVIAGGIREIISGKLTEFEMEYPCHSPVERRWFVVRVSRFEWYGDTRLIIAHQNVSELKMVQIELGESKRRIEAILDNISNGILTINPSGEVQTANPAAAEIFDYEHDQILGAHLSDLLEEPFEGRATLKKLNGRYGHELIGRRRDGSTFPIYFALNELRLDDGSLFTCIIQDITMRKRMEAEIIERERVTVALEKERELRELKNRFLSMMSHELRTPLASIGLSYDMLKKYGHVSTPEERDQALDNIHSQVHYLTDMVSDVMTLSRGESTELELEREEVDLITYCRDVVEEYQFNYHKTHRVDFECPHPDIRIPLDRKLMRRVLNNLLSNAVKYTPEGGTVLLKLYQDRDRVIIEVIDSGIGIPPQDQVRLFEPFHRAENVSNLPGTGLGLAITRQAVERHGGSITFESSDDGTTFRIELPATL